MKWICYTHKKSKTNINSNNGFVLKKVRRMIKFNQIVWLKPYIGLNTDLIEKKSDI